MKPRSRAVPVFLALLLCLLSCGGGGRQGVSTVSLQFHEGSSKLGPPISAEIVSTPEARSQGLMYRKQLGEHDGMLFVFPKMGKRSFWMKNTYISLDIIYLNEEFQVVSIIEKARPLSTRMLPSKGPAKYALEINGGKATAWGIKKGSSAVVDGVVPEAVE